MYTFSPLQSKTFQDLENHETYFEVNYFWELKKRLGVTGDFFFDQHAGGGG
jgi:hypothetical protein